MKKTLTPDNFTTIPDDRFGDPHCAPPAWMYAGTRWTLEWFVRGYTQVNISKRNAIHYLVGDRLACHNARGHGNRARRRMARLGMLVFRNKPRALLEIVH